MNKVAEEMIRAAFEEENFSMDLSRRPLDSEQYADLLTQDRWMGWQQATQFWMNEAAPIKRMRPK